jgi:PAS domain S-box-containing protein
MSIENPKQVISTPIEVLHVDDDPSVLDLIKSFLETESETINVATASTPTEGLAQLRDGTLHCIISDYEMPAHDGLELLSQVRERYPSLPFILYTGKGSEEIAADAINAGVTGYLQKGGPDQIRRLANRVEHAVTEYQARAESERYSTVLQALDYPVYVVDDEGYFEYVNQAFVNLTGYDRQKIVGNTPELIKTEEGVETANEMLADIVSSTGPDRQKFRVDIQTADGSIVPCYDHMAALPFDEEFRGSVGILRDATAEQQRRRELLRQNERLEEFTSVVSHDLRTPLGNAQTAAELARTTGTDEAFDRLETELERMDRMIDDLLVLAHEGQTVSETEPVDVATAAAEAWEPFCCAEDTLEQSGDELTVDADPPRLRRLLENLVRNAVEHASSPVTVTVGPTDDGFYVADDGPGIDEERSDTVFEPGYTTAADGTGFGLSIVKRIADAHGWEIALSESETGGARFEFVTAEEARDPTVIPSVTG